ncbi:MULTISPECIES: DUF4062 domain-containing protein [Pseudomonas]|uniref:DUF4062 domain-containing protein n=1 Tax=Pseudomonas wuhanensis TaxID=2954098 RepID=A0ABY9GXB8_9PSED|nr:MULTISPECIES: DUF4062 domain-containing protein [unclassified Pseudomonas]WLI14427.1 DUF4062 domain-containing protein [Pseudomonas sp. FP603]WLI20343.1 DUF4062 domain-containing protein [Pseudomonas sp. FP607]
MDKRYQVFVSSTYKDLKDERQSVTETLMGMDCIPASMELFPAADEEQWEFIKKIIDDCDYYLLIIGGRYGSLSPDGISYTEKEFDYAVEKRIKVVALIHRSPNKLSFEKSEESPEAREKLQAFREKVSTGRLVGYWDQGSELAGLVALSLGKTIRAYPAVGWIRASEGSSEELLKEINELRKENERLNQELSQIKALKETVYDVPDLAGFDDVFELHGTYWDGFASSIWKVKFTWRQIFYYVSPYLVASRSESSVKEVLRDAVCFANEYLGSAMTELEDQDFQTVAIQLKALGVVKVDVSNCVGGVIDPLWTLTGEGEKLMVELRAVRKSAI